MALFILALVILLLTAEFTVFVWVADIFGWWDAVALSVLISLVGIWLSKRAGLGAARRIREASEEGRVPSREVADGALILLAGLLLLVPGFVTDIFGAALLLPPVRAGVRVLALRQFRRKHGLVLVQSRRRGSEGVAEVWDVRSWEEDPNGGGRDGRGERGRSASSGPEEIEGPR
jgi:UPF0716 protein FxsA